MAGKFVKILSGPHLGAEVELGDNPLTLGSDAGCDLIVDDRLVAGCHITLSLRGGACLVQFNDKGHIQPADSGQPSRAISAGESVGLSDGDLIMIGATYLCVGPAEGAWPQIPLPDWISLNGATPAKAADNGMQTDDDTPTASGLGPEAVKVESDDAAPKAPKVARRRMWAALPVVCIAIAAVPLSHSVLSKAASGAAADQRQSAQVEPKSLNEICQSYGTRLEDAEGRARVSGELESVEEVQRLRQEVLGAAPNADFRVHARSEVVRAAKAVLAGYRYQIEVQGFKDGVLSLLGWAPSQEEWERVLVRLSHDVPGVTRFNASVSFLSTVNEAISDDLRRNALTEVQIELSNQVLKCKGLLPSDKAQVWKQCLTQWEERFSVISEIRDETVLLSGNAPEKRDDTALQVASIIFEPMRCFITAAGASFYEGAKLPDGHIVESIAADGIVLRRGDERKELSLMAQKPSDAGDTDGI